VGIAVTLFHRHSLFVVGVLFFHTLDRSLGNLELSLSPFCRSLLELGEFPTPLLGTRLLGSTLLGFATSTSTTCVLAVITSLNLP
jgi:hypothetical protein